MEVSLELHDGIGLVRMDDGKMNAITAAALEDIARAVAEAEAKAEAIVLAGRPGAFCAGFDRAVMTGDDAAAKRVLGRGGAHIAHSLFACPKPVVGASTGHAFTIGALWLMACDTRIGERGDWKYAMTETVMGAILGEWPMALLESRIPAHLLTPIAIQSQLRNPEAALEAGYVDELVDTGQAIDRALTVAKELAALPAHAYAGNKLSVRRRALERIEADLAAL
ncbi:MAG: crotonase/enoyl-CoA hydratase family protein [Pseudomonadales bacterium]|jgi:enoyl-CoA hydratase|nr:crotonase/enoyl-CoA hydratase family protein [Pseudomonadales bacterium]